MAGSTGALSPSTTVTDPMTTGDKAELLPEDRAAKDAAIEYLMHRGENPYRILRGGQYYWETHVPAMKAALKMAARDTRAPSPPASGEVGDELQRAIVLMSVAYNRLDRAVTEQEARTARSEIRAARKIVQTVQAGAAVQVPEGWRSMDDAPNTGCQVLLYGHWKQFHGTADESNHVNCGHYANGWVCEGRYNEFFIPIAWQPMPKPPAAPQKQGA